VVILPADPQVEERLQGVRDRKQMSPQHGKLRLHIIEAAQAWGGFARPRD
jgi:hypothetical protein